MLDSDDFLSNEEKHTKKSILDLLSQYSKLSSELTSEQRELRMRNFSLFREIRGQIEKQRDELKRKINDVATEMIEATNKHEEYLHVQINQFDDLVEEISVESITKRINEEYRHLHVNIEQINQIKRENQTVVDCIEEKILQIKKFKNQINLCAFQPNLQFVNENFGELLTTKVETSIQRKFEISNVKSEPTVQTETLNT